MGSRGAPPISCGFSRDHGIMVSILTAVETRRDRNLFDATRTLGYCRGSMPKIPDFRGLDSSRILILRGGIPRPMQNFPESLSRRILVGIILVGRLGVWNSWIRSWSRRGYLSSCLRCPAGSAAPVSYVFGRGDWAYARREVLLNATTRRGPSSEVIGVIGVGQDI